MTPRPAHGYRAGARRSVGAAVAADYVTDISYTEFASADVTVGVSYSSAIYLGPAFTVNGVGILRSVDNGETWKASVPDGSPHRRTGPCLHLDSDRLYFLTARFGVMPGSITKSGFDLSVSDDGGSTWITTYVASKARERAETFSGPRVASPGRVVYLTAPTPLSTTFRSVVGVKRQTIWRSFDGCARWEVAGGFDIDPKAIRSVPDHEHVVFGSGVVAPDGTVYLGGRYGSAFAVAASRDEGVTWTVGIVPGSRIRKGRRSIRSLLSGPDNSVPQSIAVDDDGTIFAVWPDPRGTLRAAFSSDAGTSWSQPVVVTEPTVTARLGVVTATGAGRIAIAYYGREGGRAMRGLVAFCKDFRVDEPVFVGGRFDDEDAPLYPRGCSPDGMIRVRFAPDGDVLVSATMQMRGKNKHRPWSVMSTRAGTQAVLGHLARRH